MLSLLLKTTSIFSTAMPMKARLSLPSVKPFSFPSSPSSSWSHGFLGRYRTSDIVSPNRGSRVLHQPRCRYASAVAEELRSSDLVALEYADLNLSNKMSEEVGHVRIRQHVNPLCASFSAPVEVPDWNAVFCDPKLPLMVDIGSGSGRFLLWLAKRNIDSGNYLGLEIRKKLVKRAQFWAKELALNNIYFMFANATISFEQLISSYPGSLKMVSILCPDPHFKKRHRKRRVVQKPLVDSIANNLISEGQVFIQSDVLDLALDMRSQFEAATDTFQHIDEVDPGALCDEDGWLLSNPMGIRTEREIHAESECASIYRRVYQKRS